MVQFDITHPVTWLPLVAGVIIPFLVAWLTTVQASPTLKSVVAAVAAALTSLGAYLADGNLHSWNGALSVFVYTAIVAAASRKTFTDHAVAAVQVATPGVIGPKPDQSVPPTAHAL